MRRHLAVLFLVFTGSALAALGGGQALASHVQCGAVLTQDTTLDSDVVCPSPDDGAIGLRAQSNYDSVALDLDGHTVVGRIVGGSRFSTPFGALEVGNGTVRGAVELSWARDGVFVHDLRIRGGRILVGFSPASVVRNFVTDSREIGITVDRGSVDMRDNTVKRSGSTGIWVRHVGGVIADNVSSRNLGSGIYVEGSGNLRIENNKTDRNAGFPSMFPSGRNGDGIEVDWSQNGPVTVSENHAWFNENLGVHASVNPVLGGAPGATGSGNSAKHNGNPAQCDPASMCIQKGKPKK